MNKINRYKSIFTSSTLLYNSLWAVWGSAILRGAGLISGIYIARLLGADKFGAYGILKNFVYSLAIISTFGLGYTATKFIAENNDSPENLRAIVKNSNRVTFGISILITLVIFFFSDKISAYLFKDPALTFPVKIIAIWLFFNGFTTLQQAYLAGLSEYKGMASINTQIGILSFFIGVVFTKVWSLNGALFALLIVQVVNFILNYVKIRKKLQTFGNPIGTPTRSYSILNMVKTNIPVTLHDLSYSFFSWFGSYLLITLYSYTEVGVYAAAMQWFLIIIYIPGVLKNVILSSLADKTSDKGKIISKMLKLNFVITGLVALAVTFGSPLLQLLYGSNFGNLSGLLILLSATAVLTSIANVYVQALVVENQYWFVMISRFIYDSITICIFLFLTFSLKNMSLSGAVFMAISFLASTSVYLLIVFLRYKSIE